MKEYEVEAMSKREPEVRMEVAQLQSYLQPLDQAIGVLYERLSEILRKTEPSTDIGVYPVNSEASYCELGTRIRTQVEHIQRLNRTVQDIIDRLEV